MSRWQRPAGPLNIWKVVDGYETLNDGTRKPVKFSIQDVPGTEKRYKEILEIMTTHFLAEEAFCKSMDIKNDPEGIEDISAIWRYGLDQGVVVGCYKLDADGQIGKLIGANVLFIVNEATKKDFFEIKKRFKSPRFKKIWNRVEMLGHKADVTQIYGIDKYIGSISLSVLPPYRGQKLGYHILDARSAIARKYGLPATSSLFTAEASQIQAKRAGFEEGCSVDYVDFIDDKAAKTGDKFIRKIVPANTIKKFSWDAYLINPTIFSKKQFKYKNVDGTKKPCFILHAAESMEDVLAHIRKRRMPVPSTLNYTLDNLDSSHEETVLDSKKDLKRSKSEKKQIKNKKLIY